MGVLASAPLVAGDATIVGEAPQVEEDRLRAAFLLNFVKFVEWPQPADGPIVIGVFGEDDLATSVEALVRGKSVRGRSLAARRLGAEDDPQGCDVLFVPASLERRLPDLLRRVAGPVLIVGEAPHLLRDGGHIRLFVESNRLRFQINADAAHDAGLKISSQLLSLAVR